MVRGAHCHFCDKGKADFAARVQSKRWIRSGDKAKGPSAAETLKEMVEADQEPKVARDSGQPYDDDGTDVDGRTEADSGGTHTHRHFPPASDHKHDIWRRLR